MSPLRSPPATTIVLAQLRWSETTRLLGGLLDELAVAVREGCVGEREARAIDHALELAIRDLKRDLRRFGDALARLGSNGATRDDPETALLGLVDRAAELLPPPDLVELMDRNGFVELSLDTTLTATLDDLAEIATVQLARKEPPRDPNR